MDCLKVTNFAINCRFLEAARVAKGAEDLRSHMNLKKAYGITCLHNDSRPEMERSQFVLEEYDSAKYWRLIFDIIPTIDVALHIVRDIFWFTRTVYDKDKRIFSTKSGMDPQGMVAMAVFDYPQFEPFRYAYVIIERILHIYSTVPL